MDYFNTVTETGEVLVKYQAKAKSQQAKILEIFKFFDKELSPEDVHKHFENTPLTSIRRAMSNMSREKVFTDPEDMHTISWEPGSLVMTGNKVRGKYGRMINTWRLATEEDLF